MTKSATLSLEFEDPRFAAILFGEFDQNIAFFEQQTGLNIISKGNQLTLSGNKDSCEEAVDVLSNVYKLIKQRGIASAEDVRGAMKVSSRLSNNPNQEVFPFAKGNQNNLAQISTRKKTLTARNASQQNYIRAMQSKTMVFGVGPAGTGKTYLAAAQAVALLESGDVSRVILSRPAVEAGERIGFLPGDMKEKVDPYLRPLYDAIHDMMPSDKVERAIANQVIEIAPLAFMRGRTLADAAIVLDEAQNTTIMQMKMFLTRLGEGSRMYITGDPSQNDLPRGETSGLKDALDRLHDIEDISILTFTHADVVRHPLVGKIVRAYETS